jgi:uncharacterized membrane protein (DUF4010 family)
MRVENLELLERLGVALALGLLIGMERGWERRELPAGERAAGFRTFGLISLLGSVTVLLSPSSGGLFFAPMVAVLGIVVALGYWREAERSNDLSLTSEVAALLAFALGALAGEGELMVAASTAVVVTLLLGFKPELHSLLERIEREELLATLRLLLISVVLLPILPDKGFGPWMAINPYRIWWMVVLVAGISYVGYFGIKLLGNERGVLATGLLGGLVSSTAVALNFSRRGREQKKSQALLAAGVVTASATMFPRMLVVVAAVAPNLVVPLLAPMLTAGIAAYAIAGWYAWRAGPNPPAEIGGESEHRNPLDLGMAVRFGLLLAAIMFLAKGASQLTGERGLYGLAAISGLTSTRSHSPLPPCQATARSQHPSPHLRS